MANFDVFNNNAFGLVSLTASINKMPHAPTRLRDSGIFTPKGVNTTSVMIEEKQGKLTLIQTSERGSPPSESENRKRKARNFQIQHLSRMARLLADEVAGIRGFGTEGDLEAVMTVYNERVNDKMLEMDITTERLMLGALSGLIVDADDTQIYDLFGEFGVAAPADSSFAFSTITQANADKMIINKLCVALKRYLLKAMGGMATGNMRIKALCGDNFFDDLVHNAETVQPYKNWMAAAALNNRNLAYQTFHYGGVDWENYRGSDDGLIAIGTNECRFYVEGVPGLFDIYFAPADTMEFVNTKGLPMYALPFTDPRNKFWEAEIQSNPLPLCTRPETLVRGVKA